MPDLSEEIRKLKEEGMSLRGIATALGISHEAVRKRLKNAASKERVSTKERNQELTGLAIKKGEVSTGSNARISRVSEQVRDAVNRVSAPETPSLTPAPSVNPSGTLSLRATGGKKGGKSPRTDDLVDLVDDLIRFLETKGVEVYRMEVGAEAYQARHNGQVVRFYVQRNNRE